MLNSDGICVEILKNDIVEIGDLRLLVELQLDVSLARLLLHSHCFIGNAAVNRHDVELLLILLVGLGESSHSWGFAAQHV